jgi:hypothetical protein
LSFAELQKFIQPNHFTSCYAYRVISSAKILTDKESMYVQSEQQMYNKKNWHSSGLLTLRADYLVNIISIYWNYFILTCSAAQTLKKMLHNIVTGVSATVDGVWIDEWIY